jgi:nitroimidazol reductase NimA-like FMN-containing flavoprotein (pyridoxamine 5'-phosphate oxidase superfamily)
MFKTPSFSRVRVHKRAHYDEATVHQILDLGHFGHVGFIAEGRPMVIPMVYARGPGRIWLHGASKTRLVKLAGGAPLSLTVTLVDGIVAARSGFHHSMNYRSVVVHGRGRAVTDAEEIAFALQAITEHLLPGRQAEIRSTNAKELKATGVIALEIEAASAKARTGPPVDDPEDHDLGIWAGVVPVVTVLGAGTADTYTPAGIPEPASVARARAKFAP